MSKKKLSWSARTSLTYCVILLIVLILVIIVTGLNKMYWNRDHEALLEINKEIEEKDSDLKDLSDETLTYVHPFLNDPLIEENMDKIVMERNYRRAMEYYDYENYFASLSTFIQNPTYRDSKSYILELFEMSKKGDGGGFYGTDSGYNMIYRIAKHKMEYHEYDDSIVLFEIISDYQDSDELLSKCKEKLENEKEK